MKMKFKSVDIIEEQTYRSIPLLNITNNMVKVTLTCSVNEWHSIKRYINNIDHSKCNGDCINCCQNTKLKEVL